MFINVKNLSGRTVSLNIPEDCSIYYVKEKVQEMEGISPSQQKLIFEGRILDDTKQVSESNIKPGNTLHMVLALRGGSA